MWFRRPASYRYFAISRSYKKLVEIYALNNRCSINVLGVSTYLIVRTQFHCRDCVDVIFDFGKQFVPAPYQPALILIIDEVQLIGLPLLTNLVVNRQSLKRDIWQKLRRFLVKYCLKIRITNAIPTAHETTERSWSKALFTKGCQQCFLSSNAR